MANVIPPVEQYETAAAKFDELIERVEGGEGPDRELDARIHFAISWRCRPDAIPTFSPGNHTYRITTPAGGDGIDQATENYTASIDAALALVDRRRRIAMDIDPIADGNNAHAAIARMYFGHAKTLERALCAAALRAIKATAP